MSLDSSARGPGVAYDKQPADASSCPALHSGDLDGEPGLPIEHEQGRLHVRHDRLHLDNQDNARLRVECQHVNGPSFASNVERDLEPYVPVERAQRPRDDFDQRGVIRIEEPVELFTVPTKAEVQASGECRGDGINCLNCDTLGMTQFDP